MTKFSTRRLLLSFLILATAATNALASPTDSRTNAETPIEPSDAVSIAGFPTIGKWMIDKDGEVAHWLGYIYDGKNLAEPINIIIRVNRENAAEAEQALMRATRAAGFKVRTGHTSGYQAILGSERVPQYPSTAEHAFSDMAYIFPNDHGRIFGPVAYEGTFYFVAALSRENVDWVGYFKDHSVLHPYKSFQEARQTFVNNLCQKGGAELSEVVNLENSIPQDDTRTTGDHDGTATVLDLK